MIPIRTGDRKRLQHEQARNAARAERIEKVRVLKSVEYAGRRIGKPAGSHLDEIASLRQCIILCSDCRPKFSPNANQPGRGYVYDRYCRVNGQCDGCRLVDYGGNLHLYVHESLIGVSHRLTLDERTQEIERKLAAWEARFPTIAAQMRSA